MNLAYEKLRTAYLGTGAKDPKGNLICVGNAGAGKSTFLNKMLKMQFETSNKSATKLFHDSVDVIFSNDDLIPTLFNVWDF